MSRSTSLRPCSSRIVSFEVRDGGASAERSRTTGAPRPAAWRSSPRTHYDNRPGDLVRGKRPAACFPGQQGYVPDGVAVVSRGSPAFCRADMLRDIDASLNGG